MTSGAEGREECGRRPADEDRRRSSMNETRTVRGRQLVDMGGRTQEGEAYAHLEDVP